MQRPPIGQQLEGKTLTSSDPARIPAGIDHDAPQPALDLPLCWIERLESPNGAFKRILARSSAFVESVEISCANL
jgi:hypothetical protein